MNQQQLLLTQLLGSKELTFGCFVRLQWVYADNHYRYNFYGTVEVPTKDEDELQIVRLVKQYPHSGSTPEKSTSHWTVQFPGSNSIQNWDTHSIETSEIIWHPATLSDLHRWMNLHGEFQQNYTVITFTQSAGWDTEIKYDSSKDLLDQSTETLTQIIELNVNFFQKMISLLELLRLRSKLFQ